MNIDETTLIEIQDYINTLDKKVGLKPEPAVDPNSFRIRTKADERSLLALFW